MTDMKDSFLQPKEGIHSTQSLVINHAAHSKCFSLHIVSAAYPN